MAVHLFGQMYMQRNSEKAKQQIKTDYFRTSTWGYLVNRWAKRSCAKKAINYHIRPQIRKNILVEWKNATNQNSIYLLQRTVAATSMQRNGLNGYVLNEYF